MVIAGLGGVKAPANCSYMFAGGESSNHKWGEYLSFISLKELDVSGVANMSNMFYNCFNLTELDVSGFATSNVTDMSHMFYNCFRLTELDVSGLDTTPLPVRK